MKAALRNLRWHERGPELAAMAACLLAAIALTWPMSAHLLTRLGGDPGDPFQTLWSWRWMHDALTTLRNPFFTDRVFFPHGASLVFQTFDVPTAILTVPLWWFLPPVGVYNAGVLFAFWLTAYGMYRLARELTGDRLVSVCAGVLFTAVPYHLAHVQGHQHLVSMGWLPLYLVHLHRMLDGRARRRDPLLGGLFLGLAALASWYHLLYGMVLTPFLFADAALRRREVLFSKRFLAQAFALAGAFLLVAGPLLFSILHQRSVEPIAGAHDAVRFSGDLEAFFFPNLAQGWGHWWGGRAFGWTGNAAETALYAGYALLLAALLGALLAGGLARAYLAMALGGALLALGPYLHVGGKVLREVKLPYLLLEKLLPQIEFMGVPVRLGYVMYLGLVVAAALGLSKLRRGRSPVAAAAIALVPTAVTLVEYTPRRFIETEVVAPAPMLEWAEDPAQYAVLDLSGDYRMMWHATLHRKPMTGGNITRVPERLERWYWGEPIVQALRRPRARSELIFERVDPSLDFDWGLDAPDPRLRPDSFQIEWTGSLRIPTSGPWSFFLSSDDGSSLEIDGNLVLDNGGFHPLRERSMTLRLEAGEHRVRVRYQEGSGKAALRWDWLGPGQSRAPVPAEALSHEGRPGLLGRYHQTMKGCRQTREGGRRGLRALGVRFVVTGPDGHECLERELQLPQTYAGEGVRIYEVPPE